MHTNTIVWNLRLKTLSTRFLKIKFKNISFNSIHLDDSFNIFFGGVLLSTFSSINTIKTIKDENKIYQQNDQGNLTYKRNVIDQLKHVALTNQTILTYIKFNLQ